MPILSTKDHVLVRWKQLWLDQQRQQKDAAAGAGSVSPGHSIKRVEQHAAQQPAYQLAPAQVREKRIAALDNNPTVSV